MASISQVLDSVKKLKEKRAALDKQILAAEKNLVTEAEKAVKAVGTKKAVVKNPVKKALKKVAKKPLVKKLLSAK